MKKKFQKKFFFPLWPGPYHLFFAASLMYIHKLQTKDMGTMTLKLFKRREDILFILNTVH